MLSHMAHLEVLLVACDLDDREPFSLKVTLPPKRREGPCRKLLAAFVKNHNAKHMSAPLAADDLHLESCGGLRIPLDAPVSEWAAPDDSGAVRFAVRSSRALAHEAEEPCDPPPSPPALPFAPPRNAEARARELAERAASEHRTLELVDSRLTPPEGWADSATWILPRGLLSERALAWVLQEAEEPIRNTLAAAAEGGTACAIARATGLLDDRDVHDLAAAPRRAPTPALADDGERAAGLSTAELAQRFRVPYRVASRVRDRFVMYHIGFACDNEGHHADACRAFAVAARAFAPPDDDDENSRAAGDGTAARDADAKNALAGARARKVYTAWGGALRALGNRRGEAACYHLAVARGAFARWDQRPSDHYDARLTARAFWDPRELDAARALAAGFAVVRAELDGAGGAAAAGFKANAEPRATDERCSELLLQHGDFQATVALIASIPEFATMIYGRCYFSRLRPGARLGARCGPSNLRLRCHLGVRVPEGARVRVAGETRPWAEGECLVFDDSFEHEVWHEGDDDLILLVCDMWHPEMTPERVGEVLERASDDDRERYERARGAERRPSTDLAE